MSTTQPSHPSSGEGMRYHLEQTRQRGQVHIHSHPSHLHYHLHMQAYYQYCQFYHAQSMLQQQAQGFASTTLPSGSPAQSVFQQALASPENQNHRSPVAGSTRFLKSSPCSLKSESPSADSGISSGPDSPNDSMNSSCKSPAWSFSSPDDAPLDLSKSSKMSSIPFPHLSPSSSGDESESPVYEKMPQIMCVMPDGPQSQGIQQNVVAQQLPGYTYPSLKTSSTPRLVTIAPKPAPPQPSPTSPASPTSPSLSKRPTSTSSRSRPRPYSSVECSVCQKVLKSRSILTVHMRTHTGERPYTCRVCHKSFADHSVYWRHKRTHTGERRYSCHICRQRFAQSSSISRHLAAVHAIIKVD